jgi:sulfonate transport system substrate-binding protein
MVSMNSQAKLFRAAVLATSVLVTTQAGFAASAAESNAPLASVNFPIEGWTVVAQAKGFFKVEFDKLGTEVKLVDPGTTQLIGAEAAMLDRGGLAIAMRMIYPATVQKANGIDASIVWMSTKSSAARTPVLALKSSSIQTVADLDGKNFGSSRISCGWTSPTEILEKAGLPLDTKTDKGRVRFTNISNPVAGNAALLSGRIDASSTHVALPDVAALLKTGEVKVIGNSPDDGVYVNSAGRVAYFAMREFVQQHPEHIRAFLKVRERAIAWINANVDEAAKIVAHDTRVPIDIARFGIVDDSEFQYMKGEPSAAVAVDTVEKFQKWYIDHGDDILKSRHLSDDQIQAFIDRRFFRDGEYSIYANN